MSAKQVIEKSPIKVAEEYFASVHLEKFRPETAREAAVAMILCCLSGDFKTAQKHVLTAVEDPILGAVSLNIYATYTQNYTATQQGLQKLKRIYPLESTDIIVTTEPRRDNYLVGQSGSPLKFEEGRFYSLDATLYKLIAFDTVARIGARLGDAKCIGYAVAYDALSKSVMEKLYDTEDGVFKNRTVQGKWSAYYGIASLFPLVAGIPMDKEKLWSLLRLVADKRKFLVSTGVSTLPVDSNLYGKSFVDFNGNIAAKYESFSGMVAPELAFLTYLGLVRCGADALSADLAERCLSAFNKEWKNGLLPAYYLPNGKASTAIDKNCLSAGLMLAMQLIEFAGPELYTAKSALHFGLKSGGSHKVSAGKFNGLQLTVTSDNKRLAVSRDDVDYFFLSGANATIRNYQETDDVVSFLIDCTDDCRLELTYPLLTSAPTASYFTNIKAGKSIVRIDIKQNNATVVRFN